MTRALFLAHTAAPSGAELAMYRLVRAMDKTDVTVVFTEDGPIADRLAEAGIDVTLVTGGFDSRDVSIGGSVTKLVRGVKGLLTVGWRVGAVARECGADVIVAESTKALLMGAVASRRAGVPVVWHSHDRISREYFGTVMSTFLRLLGWVVGSGYIANSRSTLDSLVTWHRPAVVAYPGIELPTRPPESRRAQSSPEDTIVCLAARLTPWKGHVLFLRALADLPVKPAQVYLVGGAFFGEESYRVELEALAAELDLPVTFTGHVEDPQAFMRRSDILVHCTLTAEPFGQVVVEGMLAGCAVLASRPGGTEEIVDPGVNGMLVQSGDQAELTAALAELIADRELRETLAAAGPARAARFDIVESARVVQDFLEHLLDRRAPQPVGSRRG